LLSLGQWLRSLKNLDPKSDLKHKAVLGLLKGRRMTRDFKESPLELGTAEELVDVARYAPRAGNTDGIRYLILENTEVSDYWAITMPDDTQHDFPWPGLLKAPTLILIWVNSTEYLDRYSEADKSRSGLGDSESSWSTPYWWVDGGMAAMAILIAAESQNLGTLFFGVFEHENMIKSRFDIPDEFNVVGAIAVGHGTAEQRKSKSTLRKRLEAKDLIFKNNKN